MHIYRLKYKKYDLIELILNKNNISNIFIFINYYLFDIKV